MVNTAVLQKATLGLHIFQAFWSIVVMGVIVTGMVQEGPASGAAKFMFGMVSYSNQDWVWNIWSADTF
jgi:hypothetical protein